MAFWNHFFKTEKTPQMNNETANPQVSRGTSGFHGFGGSGAIAACGWADYMEKSRYGENLHHMQGVAFRIHRECFPDGPVRLFYLDEDDFGSRGEEKILQLIRQYSSGISNVHTERRLCQGWHDYKDIRERTLIVFDLDADAIHHTVILSGQHVLTKDAGSYIFVLPRCGEFYCVLGEIRDEKLIPLHKDDFCMK